MVVSLCATVQHIDGLKGPKGGIVPPIQAPHFARRHVGYAGGFGPDNAARCTPIFRRSVRFGSTKRAVFAMNVITSAFDLSARVRGGVR